MLIRGANGFIQVYIFIGSIIVGGSWWKDAVGTIVGLVGIGYAALEYIPSIEPPANMRFVARRFCNNCRKG